MLKWDVSWDVIGLSHEQIVVRQKQGICPMWGAEMATRCWGILLTHLPSVDPATSLGVRRLLSPQIVHIQGTTVELNLLKSN